MYDGHERVLPGEGSVPTVVYNLAKYTAAEGHEVTILERRWAGADYREEIEGIEFCRLDINICSNVSNEQIVYEQIQKLTGFIRFFVDRTSFAIKANRFLRRNEFDVIHVHLPFAAIIMATVNRELGTKMVYTAHVGEEKKRFRLGPHSKTPLPLRLFSPDLYLMKRIGKSVVLNEPLRRKLVGKGIIEHKVASIPNGIEIANPDNEFCRSVRREYGAENKHLVLFSGSVTPRKGLYQLVRAADILSEYEDILFLIVGSTKIDRKFVKFLTEYIRKMHLKNVRLTGFVPYRDLSGLYDICSIFVLPSFEEGDSISLKEALAAGKPLIGTRVGGIPAMIKDGWNGFLFEPEKVGKLAEKIKYLIDNAEKRAIMGSNSRDLARKEFSWETIANRYIAVYEDVARRRKQVV